MLTISLIGVSDLAAQVVKTMREHPELLSKSFTVTTLRVYHTHHLLSRALPPHSRMH